MAITAYVFAANVIVVSLPGHTQGFWPGALGIVPVCENAVFVGSRV